MFECRLEVLDQLCWQNWHDCQRQNRHRLILLELALFAALFPLFAKHSVGTHYRCVHVKHGVPALSLIKGVTMMGITMVDCRTRVRIANKEV